MNVNDIRERVSDLVAARLAFTAFNVTTWLRRDGSFAYRNEVNPVVHGMYLDGEVPYNSEYVKAPNGMTTILYYPPGLDLTTYDHFSPENEAKVNGPIDLSTIAVDPSLVAIPPTPAPAQGVSVDFSGVAQALGGVPLQTIGGLVSALVAPVSDPDNTCHKDKYGRINLPKALVQSIGLKPGDKADLCIASNGLVVYPYDSTRSVNDPNYERTYVVNCQGNVRIGDSDLLGEANDQFAVEVDATAVCLNVQAK